jgi:hypothetical protein
MSVTNNMDLFLRVAEVSSESHSENGPTLVLAFSRWPRELVDLLLATEQAAQHHRELHVSEGAGSWLGYTYIDGFPKLIVLAAGITALWLRTHVRQSPDGRLSHQARGVVIVDYAHCGVVEGALWTLAYAIRPRLKAITVVF